MYATIRFFGCALLLSILLFWYKRKHSAIKPFLFAIAFVVLLGVYGASLQIPIENAFLSFPSAEVCFKYTNKETPIKTIQGEDSSLVVGIYSDQHVCRIVEKGESGWKIDPKGHIIKFPDNIPAGLLVSVYQNTKTFDTYLFVAAADHSELLLTDAAKNDFISITQKSYISNEDLYTYYAYIGKPTGQYELSVDGTSLSFSL